MKSLSGRGQARRGAAWRGVALRSGASMEMEVIRLKSPEMDRSTLMVSLRTISSVSDYDAFSYFNNF